MFAAKLGYACRTSGLTCLFVAGFLLVAASGASGADCGGLRACSCGDRVVRTYELKETLGPCPGIGLRLLAGVTLDGKGHAIHGLGKKSGVVLDEHSHAAVVRNLKVKGFARGVRLAGVRRARIENVEAFENGDFEKHVGYGIDVARGAANNLLANVRVHDNADEGIHLGTNALQNEIVDSEIYDNFRENVYFLEAQGNRIRNSILRGAGAASVYVKNSRGTVVEGNRIADRPIQVRGSSDEVVLRDNGLTDAVVIFQPFDGVAPNDGQIEGGTIRSRRGVCVRAAGAKRLRVTDVEFACRPGLSVDDGATVTVAAAAAAEVQCLGAGTVTRSSPSGILFLDERGDPVAGVRLGEEGTDAPALSGEDGRFSEPIPYEKVRCPGRKVSPVRLVASRAGWSMAISSSTLRTGVVLVPGEGVGPQ